MKKYLLLILEGDAWQKMSPQEMQVGVEKHMRWSRLLRESGQLVDADGVKPLGKHLKATGDSIEVTDGNAKGVGGYYTYQARDWDEAVVIARTCPSLEFGDQLEIFEVMDYT